MSLRRFETKNIKAPIMRDNETFVTFSRVKNCMWYRSSTACASKPSREGIMKDSRTKLGKIPMRGMNITRAAIEMSIISGGSLVFFSLLFFPKKVKVMNFR